MTTEKDQLETIIWFLCLGRFELPQLASIGAFAAQPIDAPPPRDGVQPGPWISRYAVCAPANQCFDERVLDQFFRKIEVAQDAHEPRGETAGLVVEDRGDREIRSV